MGSEGVQKEQALRGVGVLVVLARADGALNETEHRPLSACLGALGLDELAVEAFLGEERSLEDALDAVQDATVRRAVLRAAYALARAGGIAPAELRVLQAVEEAWGIEPRDREGDLDLWPLNREDTMPMHSDPSEQATHIERLVHSWTLALADLALAPEEVEVRWRGRRTDISELTRRFMRGEATADEVAFKFKEDLGKT